MDAGGIENYLLRFLQFNNNDNWSCTVIVRNARTGDLTKEYEELNIRLRYQGVGYANPLKWYRLYRHFKKESYDTICDFNGNFGGIPMLVGKLAGVTNRITFYRRSSRAYKQTALKLFYDEYLNRLVYLCSTRVLSNSRHALDVFFKDRYKSASNGQFKIIPNGINLKDFKTKYSKEQARDKLNIRKDAYVIGHIGRFDPAKNHEMMFKVAGELIKETSDIRFLFCGKGTDSEEFMKAMQKYGISSRCYCLGLQDDIPMVLRAMDLFYFPSVTEGQPNALIEAMIMGLPVLASRIPPICEIIPEKLQDDVLIDPKKVSESVKRITDIYNKTVELVNLEAFMKNKFDANKNFKLFKNEF
jgi:glycosyltransferase involved in cell wall biosynthesis